jgi:hypothetical protein
VRRSVRRRGGDRALPFADIRWAAWPENRVCRLQNVGRLYSNSSHLDQRTRSRAATPSVWRRLRSYAERARGEAGGWRGAPAGSSAAYSSTKRWEWVCRQRVGGRRTVGRIDRAAVEADWANGASGADVAEQDYRAGARAAVERTACGASHRHNDPAFGTSRGTLLRWAQGLDHDRDSSRPGPAWARRSAAA